MSDFKSYSPDGQYKNIFIKKIVMCKQEIYAQLKALNQESESKFDVYHESGIYTLMVDVGNGSFSPICFGTEKECAKSIETMRCYLSNVRHIWMLQKICDGKRVTLNKFCASKEAAEKIIEVAKMIDLSSEYKLVKQEFYD